MGVDHAPIWVIESRLAISAASAATVFALAIRRAALSRLVESARALGLDAGGRIYAGGAEQQYRPARWRLTKKPPRIAELESQCSLGICCGNFRPES